MWELVEVHFPLFKVTLVKQSKDKSGKGNKTTCHAFMPYCIFMNIILLNSHNQPVHQALLTPFYGREKTQRSEAAHASSPARYSI